MRPLFLLCQPIKRLAAHNNFSDSTLFAPGIMRQIKNAGKMDGVAFIDQVHAFLPREGGRPEPVRYRPLGTRLRCCALLSFVSRGAELLIAPYFTGWGGVPVLGVELRRRLDVYIATRMFTSPHRNGIRSHTSTHTHTHMQHRAGKIVKPIAGGLPCSELPQPTHAEPPPPPITQVTRLTLCALEVFLRPRTDSGGAVNAPAPADLASAVLGSDLPATFPEARVERACARGVLPPTEVASG